MHVRRIVDSVVRGWAEEGVRATTVRDSSQAAEPVRSRLRSSNLVAMDGQFASTRSIKQGVGVGGRRGGKYHRWPTDGRVVIYQSSLEGRLVVVVVRVFFGIFFIEWIGAD